ncbi:hypothetical protein M9H77_34048 [Catharanthus roseus]|uniref:Uncharacterized protein n=1 Tax=Catharanthus roseus TaxID=4058 RepID=A0ACB9ZKT6_CATRO|nr:hypothetical protein M9H77_34048 [Catharanthus roseus]
MHDIDEDTVSDRQIDEGNDMTGCNQICAKRVVNDKEVANINGPQATRIIKGLSWARNFEERSSKGLQEDSSSKESRKLPSRVLSRKKTVLKMIDLQRLSDVVKYEIL